jgi:hypothetical protein
MEKIDSIQQYKIYVEAVRIAPDCWNFVQSDRSEKRHPEFDFHVPIFLKRTYEAYEYVDVAKEDNIEKIQRQEFNPYFIEFAFFDTIERNKVNNGIDLTLAMLNFIKSRRADVVNLDNNELKKWYDDIGKNEFPWNKGTSTETNVNDIDEVSFVATNIVSKAKFFGIDINK